MGISRYLSLTYPEALCLGLALAYLYLRHLPHRNLWRLVLVATAALLLCYPVVVQRNRSLDLYLLVDRSRSIADEGRAKQLEVVDLVRSNLASGDRLGIVTFNDKAYIEQAPGSPMAVHSFQTPHSEDASDLAEGLRTVLSLVREKERARVLILSDGEYTGQSPVGEAHVARQRGIPLHYRNLKRAAVVNLAMRQARAPDQVTTREPFRVAFTVSATGAMPGRYRLYRDDRVVGRADSEGWRARDFEAGENPIAFTDSLGQTGIHSYRLEVEATPKDAENVVNDNSAETYVKAVGERPLLLVNNTGAPDNVAGILSAGGVPCHVVGIGDYRFTINHLEGYKGVVLNNVPILGLDLRQIRALRDFVLEEGGGLLVCGGNRSFSSGGYYKSPLDPILPVSLEDRQQSKKISTAVSIVLDRSGSMAMTVGGGQTKMSLANNAAAESVRLLTAADTVSVIAVDSAAHLIVSQQPVQDPEGIVADILSIRSMGGGIFTYTGLAAAGSEILGAPQLNKHILLFADANDAEEPGAYKTLLEDYVDAGITVSVVGLGTDRDSDAAFLQDVALRGSGEVYFTEDAQQLVQYFTADTINYVRKSFLEEPAPMAVRAAAYTLSPEQKWQDFSCGGYNLLFSNPDADVAIATADEDRAPILAFWQRGLGRVAALALDAEGPFRQQANYGDVVLSAARWTMGSSVFDNLQIDVRYEGSRARVQVEVAEEEREAAGLAKLHLFTPGGKTVVRPMHWDRHDRLSASVKLDEPGCYRGVVRMGQKTFKVPPMGVPVSPEFLHDRDPDFGRQALSRLASLSGGREILDIRDLLEGRSAGRATRPFIFPLVVLSLILFVTDVAAARFGLLRILRRRLAGSVRWLASVRRAATRTRKPQGASGSETDGRSPAPLQDRQAEDDDHDASEPPAALEKASADRMDYLARSKAQAERRLRRRAAPPED